MYSRWTQHLNTEEEKDKFKKEILSARTVLDRLTTIIREDEEQLDRSESDIRAYNVAAWPYLQAHKNGTRQYMRAVQLYTDLDQQKDTNINERNTSPERPRLARSNS